MSKKLSAVLILCMSALSLSGCSWLRATGPCYGVGCPAGTEGHSGQYKQGEAPRAQNTPAPAPVKSSNAPAQSASTAAQPASTKSAVAFTTTPGTSTQAAAAQSASAPAQNASAEAKPSPLHSIGEFFAHLIPHYNSSANSAAAN